MTVIDDGIIAESLSSENKPVVQNTDLQLSLSSLPPLLLQIVLPAAYPLHAAPEIVAIRAQHAWFARIPELKEILLRMWQMGEGVLYNWVDFIRSGEFLVAMELDQDSALQ